MVKNLNKPTMLSDIKIIDLTTIIFGPYGTQMLADMGADVIKIEAPGGDRFRQMGKAAKTSGMGACHMTINRGKKSVVLDLKSIDDRNSLINLIKSADVFVHNIRGKAATRLGLDFEELIKANPDLIYVHCVGFGSGGPYSDLQAYDDVIQAASGAASLASKLGDNKSPSYIPSAIADKIAGQYLSNAVLAAYIHKLKTGEGQKIEVPMFEAFTHFLLEEHLYGATFDPATGPLCYDRQVDPARQPFKTQDGYISIVPYTDDSIIRLFEVMERRDILNRTDLATPALRRANMSEIFKIIGTLTPARSTDTWIQRLISAEIPAMPVRDIKEILDDPHLKATGFFKRRTHPTEGYFFEMQPPVKFSAMPVIELGFAPNVGEHNCELLNTDYPQRP